MKTLPYLILTLVMVVLFVLALLASWLGWFVRPTANTLAQRNAVRNHSVRMGSRYMGSGPHFGK
jgi:hypothetical protein